AAGRFFHVALHSAHGNVDTTSSGGPKAAMSSASEVTLGLMLRQSAACTVGDKTEAMIRATTVRMFDHLWQCRLTNVRDFPVPRHASAKIEVCVHVSTNSKRGSHGQRYYRGDRLGKERLFVARRRRGRRGRVAQDGVASSADGSRRAAAGVFDRAGSVLGSSRVGTAVSGVGAYGEADGAAICRSVSQERQERRQRRRSDLRGGEPAEHALRADQDARAAGGPVLTPRAPGFRRGTHGDDQSAARAVGGVWFCAAAE